MFDARWAGPMALSLVLVSACRPAGPQPTERGPEPHGSEKDAASARADKTTSAPPKKETKAALARTTPAALKNLPPPKDFTLFNAEELKAARVAVGRAAVTSVEPQATEVGLAILQAGGNAVDAAVATAFALAVTHPSAGNLGGGGFALVFCGQELEAIDFREDAPRALTDAAFFQMIKEGAQGGASVGVPGTVRGLLLMHERHGKLPLKEVVQGASRLATEGFVIGARQAQVIAWARTRLLKNEAARNTFLPEGRALRASDRVTRPELGALISKIGTEGASAFYEGATAKDIVESLGPSGLLTLDDLKGYKADVKEPLFFDFLGVRVVTMPPPSAGGPALAQNLLILENAGVDSTAPDSVARAHLIAEASRRAQAERRLMITAPQRQSTEERLASHARILSPQTWLKEHPIDPAKASTSQSLHPLFEGAMKEVEHTTHLSVVDQDGGVVSLTVTLSGSFGSAIVTPKTGVVLNNSVASFSSVGANVPKAGARTVSSMAPTLAWFGTSDVLVLGSPGGDTIPSTITQTLLQITNNKTLRQAVDAPRFHQSFVPDEIRTERKYPLPKSTALGLRQLGHHLTPKMGAMGDANIAGYIGGRAVAVSDAREGGLALALPLTPEPSPEKKVTPPQPNPSKKESSP